MSNCSDCNYLSIALHRQAVCAKCRPATVQSTLAPPNGTVELVVNVPKQVPTHVQSTQVPTYVQSTQVPTYVQSTQVPTQTHIEHIMDTVRNSAGVLDNIAEETAGISTDVVKACSSIDELKRQVAELTLQTGHMFALLAAIGERTGVTQDDLERTMGIMQVNVPANSTVVYAAAPAQHVRDTLCTSEFHGPDCQSATIKTLPGGRKACTACIAHHHAIINSKGRK